MRDISVVLNNIMRINNCSPVCALFMLTEKGENSELCKLQSKSSEKVGGRLCNTSNLKVSE